MNWEALARRQAGAITRSQARAAGLSDRQVDRLVTDGGWRPTGRPGVYLAAAAPWTVEQPMWVAVLATRGVLSHLSAAQVWALDVPVAATQTHVTLARARRCAPLAGVVIHRSDLAVADVTMAHGLAVTSRRRTVLDVLSNVPLPSARTFADRCLQQRWIEPTDLRHVLDAEPNRRGNQRLRLLLKEMTGAAAESERRLHRLLKSAGIVGWLANLSVTVGGASFVVDVAFCEYTLAIEVDGWAFHSDVTRFRADRRKHNALTLAGWTVVRFTWADLVERPDEVVATVLALIEQRSGVFST